MLTFGGIRLKKKNSLSSFFPVSPVETTIFPRISRALFCELTSRNLVTGAG
jgi:hypothetical protein